MTKHHPFQCREDILEEARTWVIKFNADTPISDADVRAMQAWAKRSPAHRAALAEAEAFWCEAELLSQLAVPLPRKSNSLFSMLASAFPAMGRPGAVAASLLLGLGLTLGILWLPGEGAVGNGLYQTAIGEQKALRLRDNSLVHLDTGSQVRIDYQDNARQIYLLQGKAHFDAAKNPDRPFEVFARDGLVRAVGTAFSVYLTSEEVEVIVDEGRVDLARLGDVQLSPGAESSSEIATLPSDKQKALIASTVPANTPPNQNSAPVQRQVFLSLDRGQGARFNRERHELAELGGQALAQQLAWRDGVLVFVHDPLHEIVAEVSRYTHTTIDIADPALSDLVMGGRFRVGELDALFEVLEAGFGIEVSYLSDHHVQLRRANP